jgi:hypothetical protein
LSAALAQPEIELQMSIFLSVTAQSAPQETVPHVTDFVLLDEECFREMDLDTVMCDDSDGQLLVVSFGVRGVSRVLASANSFRILVHSSSFTSTNASSFCRKNLPPSNPKPCSCLQPRSNADSDTGIPRFLASVSLRSSVHSIIFARSSASNVSTKGAFCCCWSFCWMALVSSRK